MHNAATVKSVVDAANVDMVPAAATPITPASRVPNVAQRDAEHETSVPERRSIPPPPTGIITQEIGEKYCQEICDVYPELFDGKQGLFKNVTATMHLKEGHEVYLNVKPVARVPYGIDIDESLDKIYETGIPVDGRGLLVASQVVPIVKIKDGEKNVRVCTNYKSTINDHLMDEPYDFHYWHYLTSN